MISPEKIAEIITRVEATMCTTYSSGWTDGLEEARITKEDWETIRSELLTLRAERDEARANEWPFGKRPNPVCGHTSGDFAVYGDEKSIKRVSAALHEHDAMMPARVERIQELTAALIAAEAQLARQGEALKDIEDASRGSFSDDEAKRSLASINLRARSTLSPEDSKP